MQNSVTFFWFISFWNHCFVTLYTGIFHCGIVLPYHVMHLCPVYALIIVMIIVLPGPTICAAYLFALSHLSILLLVHL